MFERAARLKLRFETPKGWITAEDLWDLPLTSSTGRLNLNDLAVALHRKLQDSSPVSFVESAPVGDETTQLRFDLVKRVIDVRLEENKTRDEAREKAERKQRILALIADKEDAELAGKSKEELEGLLASL